MDEKTKKILKARENRWLYTNDLVEQYDMPVVTITLNIPGDDKSKEIYIYAHDAIVKDFMSYLSKNELSAIYYEKRIEEDGPEVFLIVDSNGGRLKELSVEFEENHPLGRIGDIDIKTKEKQLYSRKDLGLQERRCFLCDNPARKCILEGNHTLDEILSNIDNIINKYKKVGEKAPWKQ